MTFDASGQNFEELNSTIEWGPFAVFGMMVVRQPHRAGRIQMRFVPRTLMMDTLVSVTTGGED